MTAEIAVLNKSAVALAADSAVTISGPHDRPGKVYNGVDKLFALSRLNPVGVMVYGQAEFMGIPWEPIIKLYRKHIGRQTFDTLKQYADNFITFIETNATMFSDSVQTEFFESLMKLFFESLVSGIDSEVSSVIKKKGSVTDSQVKNIAAKVIRDRHELWSGLNHLQTVPEGFAEVVTRKYGDKIEEIIARIFQKLSLPDAARSQLRSLPGLLCSKDKIVAEPCGIVVAGFGENDIFPSVISFDLEGIVAGRLKYRQSKYLSVSRNRSAIVVPFAQSEVVGTFIEGIDPNCKRTLHKSLETLLCNMYPKAIVKKLSSLKGGDKEAIGKLVDLSKQVLRQFAMELDRYSKKYHIDPVLEAVAYLPKDELAAMAESLVNLTSFRRRVSLDVESVGGPVDVAVISKGDGFIWTKRKHYFLPEINPQFFANHYGNVKLEVRS